MAGKGKESKTSNSKHQQSAAGSTHLPSSYYTGASSHTGTHGNTYTSGASHTGTHGNTSGVSHTGTHGNTSKLFSADEKATTYGIPTKLYTPGFYAQENSIHKPSSSQPISSYIKKGVGNLSSAAETLSNVAGTLGSAAVGSLSSAYQVPPKPSTTAAAELKLQLEKERAATKRLQGDLEKERAAAKRLQGELEKERPAAKRSQGELAKERAAVKSLQGELQTERAEVLRLKGLLNKKETGAEQVLKAELKTLKDEVHRLSGQLTEARGAVRTLKTEKDAANRLKTDTERALLKKSEELNSVRKLLREAEVILESSAEFRNELQRSYDQLDIKNNRLNRSQTMAEVYENYRRWSEDQACRPLGMKKYDSWELEMAVNRANKESTGTTRYGAVYKSILDQNDVLVEILNNKSQEKQQDFNQKVDILERIRHPNLVSYIGAYEKNYALICESLPKDTLQDRLVNKGRMSPFSWEERVGVSASICSALLFLHNTKPSSIIHGDLEAHTICFDAHNVCKLSVFGLHRSTQHTTTNHNTTSSIQLDICAFGIILLQLVTGQAEKDLMRKKVLSMGDANRFQEKDIRWQREVLTNKNIVDDRLDDCPIEDAVKMLVLGLRCSHPEENQRPDLATEVWTQIQSMKRCASESRG